MKPRLLIQRSVFWEIIRGAVICGGAVSIHAQSTVCCNSSGLYTSTSTVASCPFGTYGGGIVPYTVSVAGSYNWAEQYPDGTAGLVQEPLSSQSSATGACNGLGMQFPPNVYIADAGSSGGQAGIWCNGAYYQDMGLAAWAPLLPWPEDTVLWDAWCSRPYCVAGCVPSWTYPCGNCGSDDCSGTCQDPCAGGGDGGDGGSGGGYCDDSPDGNGGSICNNGAAAPDCAYGCDSNCQCAPVADPILVDLSGAGFKLTNVQNGVQFNFFNKGLIQMSLTAAGADIGWLVLDRNGNGKIEDGSELFSNLSPQPGPAAAANGFNALAVFDKSVR